MSQMTIAKVVEFDFEPNFQDVLNRLNEAISKEFDNVKIAVGSGSDPMLKCRVKTKLFNPIVSLSGPLKIQTKANKAKVMIDVDTSTNVWFWFTVLVGFFFPPIWIIMIFMYFSQRKASVVALEKVFERLAFAASSF